MCPLLGTWPSTEACALTGKWTGDHLVQRLALNPLSHTSQGSEVSVYSPTNNEWGAPLFFLGWIIFLCVYVCVSHILLTSSLVHRHLGCFHTSAIINNAAIKWEYRYLFEIMILFSLETYPKVGVLDHMVVLFLIFLRILHTFFHSHWTNIYFH